MGYSASLVWQGVRVLWPCRRHSCHLSHAPWPCRCAYEWRQTVQEMPFQQPLTAGASGQVVALVWVLNLCHLHASQWVHFTQSRMVAFTPRSYQGVGSNGLHQDLTVKILVTFQQRWGVRDLYTPSAAPLECRPLGLQVNLPHYMNKCLFSLMDRGWQYPPHPAGVLELGEEDGEEMHCPAA